MPRSLRVASDKIERVKQAVHRSGFPRQRDLAEGLGLAISTVNNFLNGKPVDCENFLEICRSLDLNWETIVLSSHNDFKENDNLINNQEKSLDASQSQYKEVLGKTFTILWVDDNLMTIQGEVAYLVNRGVKIVVSNETYDAVQKFKSSSFDIVITDMGRLENGIMNREAGTVLARAIREINEFVPIIVFCCSGKHFIKPNEELMREGRLIGVDRFIFRTRELYEYFEELHHHSRY